ncbi:MAG: DUF4430 domain-containing protein, partial [Lachnospiraceae bacterium]|nr:DUF4430 domain-containing protein [Lachnospiraceae bacterium]
MDHWKKQLQFILHKIPFRPLIIILVLAVCLGFGISNLKIEPKSQGEKSQNQVEILNGQKSTTGKGKNSDKDSKSITSGKDNNKNKENKESSNSTNSVAESSNSTKSLTESSASKGSSKSASSSAPSASASSPAPSASSAASFGSDSSVSPQAQSSANQSGSSAETNDSSPQAPASYQVRLEIQCRSVSGDNSPVTDPTALERIHALNQGEILNANVTLSSGESVYTALVKATQAANIEMGARDTQYGVYIYEINYLREKMAGPGSGWMYSVNG